MKKPLLLSRLFQFVIVLSFFFPFFFVGCEGTGESANPSDSIETNAITLPADTLENKKNLSLEDSISLEKAQVNVADSVSGASQNNNENKGESDKLASVGIAEEYPWLKPFLYSDIADKTSTGKNFTGVGLLVNVFSLFSYISISFSFLFIIICLVSKFLDKQATRTQLVLNFAAVLSLSAYVPDILADSKALWGVWLCMLFICLTMLIDVRRMRSNASKKLY